MTNAFGGRIKALRCGKKLNQKAVASQLGLSQTTIANYENGSRFPNDVRLVRLADYFQVSLDYLLGRTDDSSPFIACGQRENIPYDEQGVDGNWSVRYLQALVRNDVKEAWRVLDLATQRGFPLATIHDKILRPALYEAGLLWQLGKMDVAQEHYITTETERFISLMRKHPATLSTGPLVISLAAGDDRHTIGIQMVSSALEEAGFNVMYLGNQLPFSSLRFLITQYPVKIIALSASLTGYVNDIAFTVQQLRGYTAFDHIPVIVGGQAFNDSPELWKKIGASACGKDAASTVHTVTALLGH